MGLYGNFTLYKANQQKIENRPILFQESNQVVKQRIVNGAFVNGVIIVAVEQKQRGGLWSGHVMIPNQIFLGFTRL